MQNVGIGSPRPKIWLEVDTPLCPQRKAFLPPLQVNPCPRASVPCVGLAWLGEVGVGIAMLQLFKKFKALHDI